MVFAVKSQGRIKVRCIIILPCMTCIAVLMRPLLKYFNNGRFKNNRIPSQHPYTKRYIAGAHQDRTDSADDLHIWIVEQQQPWYDEPGLPCGYRTLFLHAYRPRLLRR